MKPITIALPGLLLSATLLLKAPPAIAQIQATEKNIAWYITHAPFPMPLVTGPSIPERAFPISDYGAIGDGQFLNTSAFEKAIQACAAAGGGKVIVPPGSWLTGPIQLQSHIDFHLEQGAMILFTRDHSQYPPLKSSTTPPIYGHDLEDIAITGEGIIDGAGDDGICMKSSGGRWDATGKAPTMGSNEGVGVNGKPGATETNSGSGGANKAALQNVIIAGCTVYHAHGGFVIGSNTDGGVHNIAVSDCNFIGTDVGLRFKSNMGRGGLVDNIFIQDIFMRDIVNEAILFDTYYEDAPAGSVKDPNKPKPTDKTPQFRDFHISRVYCSGARTAISITGLPQMPVSRITFDTLVISAGKGLVATQARGIDLTHVKLITTQQPVYETDPTAEVRIR